MHFNHCTAEAPHVDGSCVSDAEHNLRCAVVTRLNVRVERFALATGAAEVDHLYRRTLWVTEQNVFRLEIAVDDAVVAQHH